MPEDVPLPHAFVHIRRAILEAGSPEPRPPALRTVKPDRLGLLGLRGDTGGERIKVSYSAQLLGIVLTFPDGTRSAPIEGRCGSAEEALRLCNAWWGKSQPFEWFDLTCGDITGEVRLRQPRQVALQVGEACRTGETTRPEFIRGDVTQTAAPEIDAAVFGIGPAPEEECTEVSFDPLTGEYR
jgi:hypothetical protein